MDGARPANVRPSRAAGGLRASMHRLRWRRRGEWLWPSFVALTVADAIIGHELPPQGQTQSLVAAALLGIVLNVIAVILLSRPLANVWRRARPGLPEMIARDYAGRLVLVSVTGALTIVGIVHRPAILQQQRAMRDAVVRAQAWIGDRAPATFRRNVAFADTFTIEAAHLYRICVPSDDRTRTYCVVVDAKLPFERSVSFAGYESNAVFAAGAG